MKFATTERVTQECSESFSYWSLLLPAEGIGYMGKEDRNFVSKKYCKQT